MRIENDTKLDFSDVLIRPQRSSLQSRRDVDLVRKLNFLHASDVMWSGVPIISANMDTTGTFEMAEAFAEHSMMVALHKHYTKEQLDEKISHWMLTEHSAPILNNIFLSIGTNPKDFERIKDATKYVNKIMIDIANGYSEHFIDCIQRVREACPNHVIAAGNVVTGDMAQAIIFAGADIVKIGIGSGSVCTTRLQTGVGYPQLSAVIECADAVHGLGGHLISDGGCNLPADFAKAYGAGADFVMSGSYFAGHDEGNYDKMLVENGRRVVKYYGMSSTTAQDKYNGGLKDYRSSEGRTVTVPYKGPVYDSVKSLLGGIRSTCTYVGASKIKELPKRTTFIKVNNTHNRVFENNTIAL